MEWVTREPYSGPVYDFTIPGDRTFWAEGLLVHNCDPCRDVDGTEYGSLAEAKVAYPTGGYEACLGRLRCRGNIRAVWEAPG